MNATCTILLPSSVTVRGDVTPPIIPGVQSAMLTIADPLTGESLSIGTTDPAVLDRLAANAMLLADTLRREIAARAGTPAPEKPVHALHLVPKAEE